MSRTDDQYRELIDAIRAGHEPSRTEVIAIADWADGRDHAAYRAEQKATRREHVALDEAFDRLRGVVADLESEREQMLEQDTWRAPPLTAVDFLGEQPDTNASLGLRMAVHS